jgi:hypothetical protein
LATVLGSLRIFFNNISVSSRSWQFKYISENRGLSCQTFSEILRISEKV